MTKIALQEKMIMKTYKNAPCIWKIMKISDEAVKNICTFFFWFGTDWTETSPGELANFFHPNAVPGSGLFYEYEQALDGLVNVGVLTKQRSRPSVFRFASDHSPFRYYVS